MTEYQINKALRLARKSIESDGMSTGYGCLLIDRNGETVSSGNNQCKGERSSHYHQCLICP